MRKRLANAALLLVLFTVHSFAQRAGAPAACDRECLRGFITQYLEAMVAHTPKAVPTAATARFTENTVTMMLGDGLWKNASKIGTYRQDFLDLREGVAA